LGRIQSWIAEAEPSDRHHAASERSETDEANARRFIADELKKVGWRANELATERKGHRTKVEIARELRTHTPMTLDWIARELDMGSWRYLRNLLSKESREVGNNSKVGHPGE
jgi:hypothetical protein